MESVINKFMKIRTILEKLLLRMIRSQQSDLTDADSRINQLVSMVEERDLHIRRLRETSMRRDATHRKLKSRYQKSKTELKRLRGELKKRKKENSVLEEILEILESESEFHQRALELKLSLPGMWVSWPTKGESIKELRSSWKLRTKVWKYPMRLGVLHQHAPKPRVREPIPKCAFDRVGADCPQVTVVTPSFQQAEFLERTMLSVIGQDYPNLEYFVMDASSTDGSVEIIERHEDALAAWVSEPDTGPADAINKGFRLGSGDIMAWLNSDDVWMPGSLAYVVRYFQKHPEVDAVYGHRLMIDERDNQVGHWTMPPHDPEMLLWADYIPQETLFWRRELWERTGGRLDESYKFAFDWELLLRFQRAGANLVRIPYFTGCFRVHEAQKSSALIGTTGLKEMSKLREREIGTAFCENSLMRRSVAFQGRAVFYDRLLKLGIRR